MVIKCLNYRITLFVIGNRYAWEIKEYVLLLCIGVPLGGIGSGTIGRGFKGEFCRFQMTPGIYTYDIVHANQFILCVRDQKGTNLYQKVLNGSGHPGTLSSWDWSYNPSDGNYIGLYPRAWYTYNIPEMNLILKCKQISPVIPFDYTVSCKIYY